MVDLGHLRMVCFKLRACWRRRAKIDHENVSRLNVPYDHPQVEEEDFDLPLPSPRPVPGYGRDLDPAHYHVFMARTAQVYRRFTDSISRGAAPLEEVVRSADEQLAQIIVTLPEHLQPDFADVSRDGNEADDSGTPVEPWIKWQRFDITLVLLH